ncbi:MAG: pyrroline-5-carboxylate reductase [Dehalococcoidia bacterium]
MARAMRISLVGGGVMGEAIVSALLSKGITTPEDVAVSDVVPQRLDYLRQRYGVAAHSSNRDATRSRDIILLAVKPQDFPSLASGLPPLEAEQTVVSIMPGVTIAALQEALAHRPVVRVMPNTPAQIGEGMSVWTAAPEVASQRREEVRRILCALGRELYVADEKYVEMATALSASGPAFVFLVMEALVDGGVHIGLGREMATAMALQMVLGSARFAQESGRHPAELKNMVTSPGGTTTEGLLVLEEAGVRAALVRAVAAAYDKAKRLGG